MKTKTKNLKQSLQELHVYILENYTYDKHDMYTSYLSVTCYTCIDKLNSKKLKSKDFNYISILLDAAIHYLNQFDGTINECMNEISSKLIACENNTQKIYKKIK